MPSEHKNEDIVVTTMPQKSENRTIFSTRFSVIKNDPSYVSELQQFFNKYESETLSVTGNYDKDTQEAVKRFQLKYASEILAPWGIAKPTGNVGVFTLAKIYDVISAESNKGKTLSIVITAKRNNNSDDIRKLQQFFNKYESETLSVTGNYDKDTQEAVKRFQLKYASEILAPWGIAKPTGNVGVFTLAKINRIAP